jgi:hypothetical protein
MIFLKRKKIKGNRIKEEERAECRGSKSSPVTGPEWPRGFQVVKVPRFHDKGTGWL